MKKIILTFYIYLFTCFLLTGQDLIEGVLWVTSANESAKPLPGQVITTNNHINLLLNDYGIFSFEPAFPGSKNDLLKNTYEIRFTGNTTALFSDLMVNFKDDYSFVEMHYSEPDIAVYDPEDYMWFLTLQNPDSWLWHLLKIQANDAWDITIGDPNIVIAIIDTYVDAEHPDLMTELKLPYEPYTGYVFTCNPSDGHGTAVSSFATAETTEIGGTPNGQLASVGFNTKFIFYHAWGIGSAIYLQKAHHASLVMGADVITSSAGGWRCQGGPNPIEEAAVKEILDNGTVIVMPAGNGINSIAHCDNGNNGIHDPWYPLHPIYDERIIIVTGTDKNDYHYYLNPQGVEKTHSHYPAVDICSPGHELMGAKPTECGSVTWPYYGASGGTSFATPIVAGVCGLLKSIDKNFTPGEIQEFIKRSADPVVDEQNYPGLLGAGRINAFGAVNLAVNCTPEVITGNEVWSDDRIVLCGLEIESGATLTIYSTVKLSRNSSIIVKPGGNLIIDNGLLTSLDNKFWQGIEVWGNSTKSQLIDPYNPIQHQGKIVLKNDAVIENAKTAVKLWKEGTDECNGGIIIANNAFFRNNAKAVHFKKYNNFNPFTFQPADNISYFKYCDFEITQEYIGGETFYKHADLARVKGIKFIACDFSTTPPGIWVYPTNHAIGSYSSGFSAMAICTQPTNPCREFDRCTFTGFFAGVYATNDWQNNNTFYINRADFHNNVYGVLALGVNNATVLNSNFYIGYNEPESDPCDGEGKSASGYGIYMTGCTGFAIEENYFTKAGGAPLGNYTGILIAESQSTEQVYRNTFEGLSYGNYAVGINWYENYFKGLAYFCNENTGNYADFFVEPDNDELKISGIQSKQGDDNFVTGNTFTSTGNTWHFFNGGDYLVGYYYCNYCDDESPDESKIFQVTDKPKTFSNNCPSHYGGGGGSTEQSIVLTTSEKQEAELEFAVNLSNYNGVKTLYDDLKDGGNTDAVIADIENAWPTDTWELRAELLGKSPHLSMEVLKAAADKTDVLPESIIFEVLAANPDELKKEELIKYLEDKADPLPEYMVNILRHLAHRTTYKTVLEQHMAHYNQVKTRAAYDIVRSLLNDTIMDFEQLRNWLDNVGGKRADEQIIATYLAENNYTNALALANMMPSLYAYSGNELTEHSFYMDLLNQQINLEQQQRSIFNLDSLEVANLIFIAENSQGTAGLQAKGILEYAYGHHFCNCLNISDMSGLKRSGSINPDDLAKLHGVEVNAHPNPASQWVAFNYTLPANAYQGEIKIVDAKGAVIDSFTVTGAQGQQVWDTRSIKTGVYFYTLSVGEFTKTGKLLINK